MRRETAGSLCRRARGCGRPGVLIAALAVLCSPPATGSRPEKGANLPERTPIAELGRAVAADPKVIQRFRAEFEREHGSRWRLECSPETGFLSRMQSRDLNATSPYPGTTAHAAALAFIDRWRPLLGLDSQHALVPTTSPGPWPRPPIDEQPRERVWRVVAFQQFYKGVRVLGREIKVLLSPDLGVSHLSSDARPLANMVVVPTITPGEACACLIEQAERENPGASTVIHAAPELIIHPVGAGRLAYSISAEVGAAGRPGCFPYWFILDAHTGEVLAHAPMWVN